MPTARLPAPKTTYDRSHSRDHIATCAVEHQGIGNRTVLGGSEVPSPAGTVVRIPRVGGLLNHYERVA